MQMEPIKMQARVAGLLYLVIVFCGIFYLRYVPSKLIVPDNISATISNISGAETLYRLGILAEVIADIFFLLLALALYKLFNKVNKTHALIMVLFVAISIVISLIAIQNKFAILTLIKNAAYLKTVAPGYLNSQAQLYLGFYKNGVLTGEIFWGLWLFPLGYLIIKSGFIPRFLGFLLIAGCFGYLANFTGNFLFPHYNETGISNYITLPASIGELLTCLWLLIMGAKEKQAVTLIKGTKV